MAIITISKLLREAGLDISKKIKLVRHKDCRSSQIVDGIEKKVPHMIGTFMTEKHS
jgi:hypothetical protein